jgi:hypothetical protein
MTEDFEARVKAYFDGEASEPAGRLILDLLAWGQEQAAEAKAWKHANAFEPVTAEELAELLKVRVGPADNWARHIIQKLGPELYRQRKP